MENVIWIRWDSITMWARDMEKWWRANRLHMYLLEKYLKENCTYGVVYNLGIDWDNSTWILKRFTMECEAREPNVIIFAIGANDCVHFENKENNIPLSIFQKNIQELIVLAKKYTDKIVFVWLIACDETKMNPVEWAPEMSQSMKNITRYNNTIKTICEQENINFIDMLDVVNAKNLEDGSHPTAQGHEKMYNRIKNFLISNKII